ncbi:DNA repair protein RecO [Eubacterium plexicaudatum ASF492]|nr:DNA repair protein RecO [Eubacterium plexicaudatum ASF492]
MGQTIELTGMVLSAMPVGEYDKRIQILTKERGKIAAFMRGARRPNSAFLAASNPFSFGRFEMFEGKSSYNVAKVTISHYFRELVQDPDAIYYGFYFLEMASYYTQENMDGTDFLNLLFVTLKALLKPALDNRLVRRIYELRVLVLFGNTRMYFHVQNAVENRSCTTFPCSVTARFVRNA